MEDKYLYRVKSKYNDYSLRPEIIVCKFKIVRESERYWFINSLKTINNEIVNVERKITKKAKKGYARPTILEAIKDFEARQKRCKFLLELRLENTELTLKALMIKENIDDLTNNESVYI